jgi:hypothetical protein
MVGLSKSGPGIPFQEWKGMAQYDREVGCYIEKRDRVLAL